jgi:hypothetical protein
MNPAKLAVEDAPGWKFRTQDLSEDDVRLGFYKLSKTSEVKASLSPGEAAPITGASEVGTGKAAEEEQSPLSEIISAVNSRYNTEFTEEHRVYLEVERQRLAADPQLRQQALVNTEEQFEHAFNHKADLNPFAALKRTTVSSMPL